MFSRPTRILLVVALLAAIAYMLIGRRGEDAASDSERLASLDVSRVDHLILERPGETLQFVREDSVWRMTSPLLDTAEHSTIATLLDALEHAEIARNLGEPGDLAPYGLDAPVTVMKILAGPDTLFVLELGKRTVDEAWSYARRGGHHDLLLVPTGIARAASLPRDFYRDQRVVSFQLRDVIGYSVVSDDHGTTWSRGEQGWFAVPELGDTVRGDSVAVESVLRRLRGLRVASFIVDTDSVTRRSGIGLGSIRLWQAATAPYTMSTMPIANLDISKGAGSTIVIESIGGRAVIIDDDLSDLFAHTTTSLRDRRLLQFPPQDAARIEVVLPGASGAIVRRGGAWSFPNPALGRVDSDRAADFVRSLRALKWADVPPKNVPSIPDPSRFSITVSDASGNILDEMRAETRTDSRWYVTSRSSHGSWLIEGETLAALGVSFANLKQP